MAPTKTLLLLIIGNVISVPIPETYPPIINTNFPLNSASAPQSERRSLNIAAWVGMSNATASLPVIKFAMDRALNDSLLPDYVNINYHIAMRCRQKSGDDTPNTEYIGLTQLYNDMRYFEETFPQNSDIHGVVGPYHTDCLVHVARLLGWYNIPVMPHSSVGSALANDRYRFPTMSRVAFTSAAMAQGLYKLVVDMGWTQVAIVCGQESMGLTMMACLGVRDYFEIKGIKLLYWSQFDTRSATDEDVDQILDDIKAKARIVIAPMSNACVGEELLLLKAAVRKGMLNGDFVFITAHTNGIAADSDLPSWCPNENNTYLYALPHIFKVTFQGRTRDDLRDAHKLMAEYGREYVAGTTYIVWDIGMAEAIYMMMDMMGRIIRDRGFEAVKDGLLIHQYSKMYSSRGVFGSPIILDSVGDRRASYNIQKLDHRDVVLLMTIDLTAVNGNESHMELVSNIRSPLFIGSTPLDEPECLFDNSACDKTVEIIVAISIVATIICIVASYYIQKRRKHAKLMSMTWRVDLDDLRILVTNQTSRHSTSKSAVSMFSLKDIQETQLTFAETNAKNGGKDFIPEQDQQSVMFNVGMLNSVRCTAHHYDLNKTVEQFPISSLETIEKLRAFTTDTVNAFMGIAFNQYGKFTIFWKFEARCTLYDVVGNVEFTMSPEFQSSFLNDVVKGIEYLHGTVKMSHGALNLHSCIVTPQWTIRISNYGLSGVFQKATASHWLQIPTPTLHELLHVAPEHEILTETSLPGDIYSLGVVAFEILNRTFIQDTVDYGDDDKQPTFMALRGVKRPQVSWRNSAGSPKLNVLLSTCTEVSPQLRPVIENIKKQLLKETKGKLKDGGIVDHMMKMMETYAKDLEKLVGERTASLEETQRQADRLLHQLLPKSVAEALKAGKTMQPELYSSATVGFVDIVQFTNFCAQSNPFQIVALLNELFSQFDAIVATYEAYKVETIGDAYMIVSGIPVRNGNRHAHDICATLCGMLAAAQTVRVNHMPVDYVITLRGGVHTGATAAGVVGIHAPRYCLFGDTVNTSSRMESTGVPNKVQVSEDTEKCLHMYGIREFDIERRGTIEVKGKGEMNTFWVAKK